MTFEILTWGAFGVLFVVAVLWLVGKVYSMIWPNDFGDVNPIGAGFLICIMLFLLGSGAFLIIGAVGLAVTEILGL